MTNLITPVLESGSLKQWRIQQHEALYPALWNHMGNDTVICPLLNTQWDEMSTTFVTRRSIADITGTDTAGASTTVLTDAAGDFLTKGVKAGGLLRNTTNSETAQISAVTATTVTSDAFTTTWDIGDGYTIVGGIEATFTMAGAPLATPVAYEGITPVFKLDGSAEWWETPNIVDGFWLGGADDTAPQEPAYTWMAWVKTVLGGGNTQSIWAKTAAIGTAGTDWTVFLFTDDKLHARIFDDSANAFIGRSDSTAITAPWRHIAVTKDSGVTNGDVKLYIDGVQTDNSDSNNGAYTAQENGTAVVRIGAETDGGNPFASTFAGGALGPSFSTSARTAAQVKNVYVEQAPYLGLIVD